MSLGYAGKVIGMNKNTEYLNVDNSAMTYMLINEVKEQQKQIELLTQKVKELKLKKYGKCLPLPLLAAGR